MAAEPRSSVDRRPSAEEAKAFTLQPIPPQAFGKYVLIGKLGHGGMAEVNLAVAGGKGGFRKLFVVKRLHAHLEQEPGFIDMFLDEARLAAQLDHPNCVQTVEVGEANGQHFLAMEHLDGQGLERLLRLAATRGELIPPPIAARIVADALEGLGYAHELVGYDGTPLRVVHRDVSPQNLFVTYGGVVKVLDFGIAKATSNVVETRTGVVKGKYAYIAPEQALATPIDARADLWSMGVVLWELLTARRLFKSVNELATLQETLRGDIKLPSEVVPGIGPELDAIVMRALQRDVSQRYATAYAFKADLDKYLARQDEPSDRRALSLLMKERFGEIAEIHKQKMRDCLAAVADGERSVERLVASAGGSASVELGGLTPSGVSLPPNDGGTYTPSGVGPTPLAMRGLGSMPAIPTTDLPTTPYAGPVPIGGDLDDATTREPPNRARPGSAHRLEPPPVERKKRAIGWWLVGAGALVVLAVLGAVALGGRGLSLSGLSELEPSVTSPAEAPITARVVGAAPEAPPPTVAGPEVAVPPPVVDPEPAERSGRSGRRGERSGSRAEASPEPEATPPPAPEAPEAPPTSPGGETVGEPAGDFGFLALATSPWTTVTWNGTSLGETPLTRVRMPVGRHSLRLVNEAEGISETYEVEIRPGEVTRVRLGLR